MLQRICSYYEIMPAFIRCVTSFGQREYAEECVLNTFHASVSYPGSPPNGLAVPALARSGHLLQLCYSLRSVERTSASQTWSWSVRQSTMYHSLDLVSAQSVWISIKANDIIKCMLDDVLDRTRACTTVTQSLKFAMQIHSIIAQWSADNWHRYLNFIETQLQDNSRFVLALTMDPEEKRVMSRRPTVLSDLDEDTVGGAEVSAAEIDEKHSRGSGRIASGLSSCVKSFRAISSWPHGRQPSVNTDVPEWLPVNSRKFSFKDLRRTYYLEEKLHEVRESIENNSSILQSLHQEYRKTFAALASEVLESCRTEFDHFVVCLTEAQSTLRTSSDRATNLLRLTSSRKALVSTTLSIVYIAC